MKWCERFGKKTRFRSARLIASTGATSQTIVAKALEKDKARRYASAAELAADIRHYLNDEPIVARPPSTSYQLQKFALASPGAGCRRAGAVFLVLIAGVVVSTWQAVRARRAEARRMQ